MLIYLDLDTDRLVMSPGNASLVASLLGVRGSGPTLRVQPLRGGQPTTLPGLFEMTWTVKARGDWGGDMLAYGDDFILEAGTTRYGCAINYETEGLDTLLKIGETTEEQSAALIAQLAWRVDHLSVWRPTQVVDLTLHNSVWRGVPGAPEPGSSALSWLGEVLVPGVGVSVDVGVDTITLAHNLAAGVGIALVEDGDQLVISQSVFSAVATVDQDFVGGDGVPGVFTDDDVFQFSVVANAVYEVAFLTRWLLNYEPATPVDHEARWSLPSGAAVRGTWMRACYDSALTPDAWITSGALMAADGVILSSDSLSVESAVMNHCIIQTAGTAGTAKLRFACAFTDEERQITRRSGSYLIARRIA